MTKNKYMFQPSEKPSLEIFEVPLIKATDTSIEEYGGLLDEPDEIQLEIVPWPSKGWRPVDDGTGAEGGVAEGIFHAKWMGDVLYGRNEAVKGDYVLGWSRDPQFASEKEKTVSRSQVLLWHMNYHPDGGQLFFPLEKKPFIFPAALPGDDLKPESIVAFWCDGSKGLYIKPNIWHEGVFPVCDEQKFLDRQGKVHARISCDIGEEFGLYLSAPLTEKFAP